LKDLSLLVDYIKELNIIPDFIEFEFKDNLEQEVQKIALQYTDTIDFKKLEEDYYNSIYAIDFYSYSDFEEECLVIIKQFRHHTNKPLKTIEIKEDEYEDFTFDESSHNKETIFENAKKEILRVLNIDELKKSPDSFEWTSKAYRSYYGMAYDSTDGYSENSNGTRIEINKILQLKEIPSKVIEFVVYHELLHTELENYTHDEEFKKYEAMYSGFVYCEQMLYKIASSNFDNMMSVIYQSNYQVFEKDKIANLKKLIKNEELILLTDEELQEVYNNQAFRDSLIADGKYWLLADDLTKSMSVSDGKFHKVQNAYLVIKVR